MKRNVAVLIFGIM